MNVLTDLKTRGVADVFFIVCDGLEGLPGSVNTGFRRKVQTCIVHLIRGTFRYASKIYWEAIARDLRPIYRAATPEAAWPTFEETLGHGRAGTVSPSSWPTTWRSARCSAPRTRSGPSTPLTARWSTPKPLPDRAGGPEDAVPATRNLDPKRLGQARWVTRWKPALNAFAFTFALRCRPWSASREIAS